MTVNASIEFITGRNADMNHIAIVPSALPIGINSGMEIEINHRTYKIGHTHVIISRNNNDYADSHVTYQIHVKEIK